MPLVINLLTNEQKAPDEMGEKYNLAEMCC